MISFVILAGGTGERFWPLSTRERPKQLLHIFGDKSLIRQTFERVLPLSDCQHIFISTNELQAKLIQKELPEVPLANFIIEPSFKDTGAAIGYASLIVNKSVESSPIVVVPSDQTIQDDAEFRKIVAIAAEDAELERIVTLGIVPTYPETGYGYIQAPAYREEVVSQVLSFREKPNLDTAISYLEAKDYLWNAGIFIFTYKTLMQAFKAYAPKHYDVFKKIDQIVDKNEGLATTAKVQASFELFEKKSFDYLVMEKANNVDVVPGSFGWSDVGSFLALQDFFPKDANGNVVKDVISYCVDSHNNIIIGTKKNFSVALLGIEDKVVVVTDDNLLVCDKNQTQRIKEIVKLINQKKS
jgi:mannose-1-phosphate guanylyltransferase